MEKAMAPHSSTLAWKIPWTEEPDRLQSMGSLRVRHDWVTSFSLSCTGEGNGNPLQCSCLESPRDGGAWWAAVYGVAQSRTWLKWLSSGSSPWQSMVLLTGSHLSLYCFLGMPLRWNERKSFSLWNNYRCIGSCEEYTWKTRVPFIQFLPMAHLT